MKVLQHIFKEGKNSGTLTMIYPKHHQLLLSADGHTASDVLQTDWLHESDWNQFNLHACVKWGNTSVMTNPTFSELLKTWKLLVDNNLQLGKECWLHKMNYLII